PATPVFYTLSLHDALPIYALTPASRAFLDRIGAWRRLEAERVTPIYDMRVFGDDGRSRLDFSAYEAGALQLAATVESSRLHHARSEEHTSELQSRRELVCR